MIVFAATATAGAVFTHAPTTGGLSGCGGKDTRHPSPGRNAPGSTMNGPATVHVKGLFVTESDVLLTDLLINSAYGTGAVVQNFNNNILTRVIINAPFGSVQPHNGMALRDCSHIVAKSLQLAPMTTSCAGPIEASCPPNTHFADGVSRTCVPD